MTTATQWWDEATEAPYLARQLVGIELRFGDPEIGQAERTCTIESVEGFSVGVDSSGIFGGVEVRTTDGDILGLYTDGEVEDGDGAELGRHYINWSKVKNEGTAA